MHRSTLLFAVTALFLGAACDTEYKLGNENDDNVGVGDTLPPDIEVSPGTVTFDDINVTEPNAYIEQVVRISNVGEGDLQLTGMELSDPNAPYSYGNVGSSIVAPGEFTEFIVTFVPETAGPTEATLYIDSNDPDEPVAEVMLGGLGIAPVIEVSPEVYDFGEPYIGCELEQAITIDNVGNATLVVESLEYSTGSVDLLFDGDTLSNGTLPWVLEPEDAPITVWVDYYPLDEVQDIGYLKVNSNDPLTSTVLATQEGSGIIYGMNTDVYDQPLSGPVDILFGVDKSCSMDDDIQNVKSNFSLFASTLASLDSDYHIGVVVEDSGCFSGSVNYIDSDMTTSAQQNAFDDMLSGVAGTYTEAPFQMMSNALSQSGTGGCNEGFMRDTATLALVSVSDEREQSPNGWEYYVSLFRGLKGDDDDVIMHSIAGDMPTGCDLNEPGVGHYEATVETGGEFLSICSTDFGAHLQAIAVGSVSENQNFELTQEPVPETIEVEIDKTPTTEGWEYSGYDDGNYVHFDNNHIPEPGSKIEITYVIKPDCNL